MNWSEAVTAAAARHADDLLTVHGRKAAVYDLLFDSGATFRESPKGHGDVASFMGIDIVCDEAMLPGMIDFRAADGRTLQRLIQTPQGGWVAIDVTAMQRAVEALHRDLRVMTSFE